MKTILSLTVMGLILMGSGAAYAESGGTADFYKKKIESKEPLHKILPEDVETLRKVSSALRMTDPELAAKIDAIVLKLASRITYEL